MLTLELGKKDKAYNLDGIKAIFLLIPLHQLVALLEASPHSGQMTNHNRISGYILFSGSDCAWPFEPLGYPLQSGLLGFQRMLYVHKVMSKSLADLVAMIDTVTGLEERGQKSYGTKKMLPGSIITGSD